MRPAYYNEIDPYAAEWLRRLIAAGHIAAGDVDTRSIEDVVPDDLRGYGQCHFFAGLGVWSYALRQAGVPDDAPVWTGSCPCQPFSAAGRGDGFADERHLWPEFFRLIEECSPAAVLGEQVASADGLEWLDLVRTDLEAAGYAVGASDLCAAGFGAPGIRQRLYWVGHADDARLEGHAGDVRQGGESGWVHTRSTRPAPATGLSGAVHGFWAGAQWLDCGDGIHRPAEPGIFPVAAGAPGYVDRLRAAGNALNAEVATGFCIAALGALQ